MFSFCRERVSHLIIFLSLFCQFTEEIIVQKWPGCKQSRFKRRLHWCQTRRVLVYQTVVVHSAVLHAVFLLTQSSAQVLHTNHLNKCNQSAFTSSRCGPGVCWTRLQVSAPSLDLMTKDTRFNNRYSTFTIK